MKKKRLLSLTLATAMLFGSAAALPEGVFDDGAGIIASAAKVESGQCGDNVFWSLSDDGVLTISGKGRMADYVTGDSPFYERTDIKSVVIKFGVISIGDEMFRGCSSLTSVNIPDSITSIGQVAFGSCKSLESVIIPNSVTSIDNWAFGNCTSLTSVIIPSNVTEIGEYAFYRCSSLTSVTILSNNTIIYDEAFNGCSDLSNLTVQKVSGDNTNALSAFSNITTLTLGNGITSSEDIAFLLDSLPNVSTIDVVEDNKYFSAVDGIVYSKDKTVLIKCPKNKTSVDIPETVTTIGDAAFKDCNNLVSITIPDSVTSIGASAFSGCSSLTKVKIPQGVTQINEKTFANCTNLESIDVPDSVTSIGKDAFLGTKWIENQQSDNSSFVIIAGILMKVKSSASIITIPNTVKIIGGGAFSNCSTVKAVTIPNSVVSIGNNAFENCTNLASITIPNSVKTIGEYAFKGCTNLASVSIPNSVTEIGKGAFYSCGKLSSIAIPKSVSCINPYTFFYCSSLSNVSIGSGVKSIGDGAFQNNTSLKTINIPDSVESIGEMSFMWSGLTSVTIPGSVKSIGKGAFNQSYSLNKVVISDGVETIGERAFTGIEKLVDTTIELPASVKSLGEYAFVCRLNVSKNNKYLCSIDGVVYDKAKTKIILIPTTIESIVLPDTITSIDMSMLKTYCTNLKLTKITLGKGITSISDEQFKGFDKLTSITLADAVTSIGKGAFEDCKSLTSINIPESVATIGDGAFMNCSSLKSVTVPNSVDSIGPYTFYFCSVLESLSIGNSVKSIGDGAFSHCSKLKSIIIGDSVETIGQYAFDGCSSLTSLIIPDSVKSIDYGAFISCNNLAEVSIPQSVDVVGGYAFGYLEKEQNTVNSSASQSSFDSADENGLCALRLNVNSDLNYEKIKGFSIDCCKDSAAEEYAIENNFKYSIVLPGTRIAGNNRFSTSSKISKRSYNTAGTVVLAYGLNYADALAGVPLATKLNAPILLTAQKSLPDETLAEIKRLGAKNVIILGGTGAIDTAVEKTLKQNGLKTERIAGGTRFETATKIAERLQTLNGKKPEEVFFVYALNFADALSVSAAAAAKNAPIIYLQTKGTLDAATKKYLESIKGSVKKAYVIGGTGVISDNMKSQTEKILGITAKRVFGKDRFATCVAVNNEFKTTLTGKTICVATGMDFPDALAGGVFAALNKAPLFLVNGKVKSLALTDVQKSYLKKKSADMIVTFGGTGAVPDSHVKVVSGASV